jgi:hypothetical protein
MAVAQSLRVAGMIAERAGRQVEMVWMTTLGDVSRAWLTGSRMLRAHGGAAEADAARLGRALGAELLLSGAGDLIS